MASIRSSTEPGPREGGIRKKMRKGTHSCFECRRRKIRCIFTSDHPSVCTECFARGSRCIDQEHAESDAVLDQRKNLRERVARLEALVDSMVEHSHDRRAAEVLRELGTTSHHSSATPQSDSTPPRDIASESGGRKAPLLSLFDNDVLSTAEHHKPSVATTPPALSSSKMKHGSFVSQGSGQTPAQLKASRVRRELLAVLPAYEKLKDTLNRSAEIWSVFRKKCPGTGGMYTMEQFLNRALTVGTPSELGILVLMFGSCVDDDHLDHCVNLVDRWIISDDEYMGTLEGIECSIFQGKIYADIGQARRSWLVFRRGLLFAELLGLHQARAFSSPRESIWWTLYVADRLTSLMLGLPYGIADAHCNMDFGGTKLNAASAPHAFMAKIGYFAGRVVDRNQGLREATYSSALDFEQELTEFAAQLPPGWLSTKPQTVFEDVKAVTEWQEKVLSQIAFHQLKVYLHLPFMLKSATNIGYEHSRRACLDGARELLRLYHMLRAEGMPMYECKAVDFIGFTASVFLVLGLLGYGGKENDGVQQDEADWTSVEKTMEILKRASGEKGGQVAAQGYEALEKLSQARDTDCSLEASCGNDMLKIFIPFFGMISIRRGQWFKQRTTASTSTQSTASSVTGPSTPSIPDISQHTASTYSSMDPFIAYDGFYMPPPSFEGHSPDGNLMPTSYMGSSFNWQTMSMDIDQDWLASDMPLPAAPAVLPFPT
ncbi:hypothetical protein EJ06DRAFT_30234 [Trichodelitschia bisporula]|uniref:Zn(2)-C6 fungal-type domain-containing protein n=1 Tax=Trichodelitschia bisporula TaxID=703511 RepID=A0A6G1IC41_9PEZI|nr:hypothetical protein EJ06DRAFT_30234 [Trichodelitschia bisporula]